MFRFDAMRNVGDKLLSCYAASYVCIYKVYEVGCITEAI